MSGARYRATEREPHHSTASRAIFTGPVRGTTLGIIVLVTLIAFEAMAVAAALPTAARAVHGLGAYGWAFTGYLVASVVGMVGSGQLTDLRGPRLPLIVGLGCFVAGLLVSGTAATMVQLVAGRVVQGLGGGLIITAIYVVIGHAYSEAARPPLFAAMSSAWVVPSLIGPGLAGALAQHVSWRLVFLALVPFALGGGALLVPVLRRLHGPDGPGRPSGPHRLAYAVAVAAGVAALEQAGQHPSGWSAPLGAVGLGVLVLGLRPLLPAGTFRARSGVAAPVALRGVLAGAFFGVEATLPLSLSVQHHYGATLAGLPLAAAGFSWSVGSWWQGRTDDSAGPARRIALIRAGFLLVAAGAAGIAVTSVPACPGWLAYPSWLVAGLGAGLSMSSVSVLLLKYTTDVDRGADSAALQLSDATSSALTTGVAGVLVAAAARAAIGYTAAFVVVDLAMAALALCGAAASGRARPAPA